MAENLEPRLRSLEEYQAMFYQWIDELRKDRVELREFVLEMKQEHEARIEQNEEMIKSLIVLHQDNVVLLSAINERMNGLENRMK